MNDEQREGASDAPAPHAHIALPSSAVTDISVPTAHVTPPAVRIEDRWDDYLPPSPRSMEDSGFWERPQPGATDFWAADEDNGEKDAKRNGDGKQDGNLYVGRRHLDGAS
ncbi:hypothetical protein [Nonomuraea sp. NPDC002799]